MSDAEAVQAVLAGDRDAYAVLVRRYQDVLYRHAERMTGSADEAADVVQRTFIRGFRGLKRCQDPERVGGWLFRIAANQCKDVLKSRARREVSLDAVAPMPTRRGRPEAEAERSELREELRRAVMKLGDEQREAFVLKHVEGWSYEEMAEKLEVSVSALKMRVHRARERLQGLLEHYR